MIPEKVCEEVSDKKKKNYWVFCWPRDKDQIGSGKLNNDNYSSLRDRLNKYCFKDVFEKCISFWNKL